MTETIIHWLWIIFLVPLFIAIFLIWGGLLLALIAPLVSRATDYLDEADDRRIDRKKRREKRRSKDD